MILWIAFLVIFVSAMLVELVLSKQAHEVTTKEASIRTVIWVLLALAFNVGVYLAHGSAPAVEFLTGYLIELSLSVDNLFVFILLFTAFHVPSANRQRVLTWGILGAIVLRALMIFVGAGLLARFEWLMYLFGAFLVYTGVKMALPHDEKPSDPADNGMVKAVKKLIPVTDTYQGDLFFVKLNGLLHATPLLLVLVMVEGTDVMFALDSIPAIFAITKDPFIVLTSNLFAIIGLRSLYFLLDGMMDKFRFLKYGLAVILTFIGVKMLLLYWHIHIHAFLSLGIVLGTLVASVLISFAIPEQEQPDGPARRNTTPR